MKKSKKIISLLLSILMIITSVPLMAVNSFAADEITSGDYKYTVLDDGTAKITKYTGSATELTIPSEIDGYSVTSIGSWAFSRCTSLESITISKSVTSIETNAFSGCTSLTSIMISDGVTSIGNYAFSGCSSLTEINVSGENADYSSVNGLVFNKDKTEIICYPQGKKDLSYSIPDSVTEIGESAFYGCGLTSITMSKSVTSIGDHAFFGCTSLASITIPDSVRYLGNAAFEFCCKLESVTLGSGIAYIGNSAFCHCTSLESITIPKSVTSIGDQAFFGCTSLTSITIPDSVTSIGSWAFSRCTSLANIIIPDSITSIGSGAFNDCTSLTSATIGNGVTNIADADIFLYCISLTEISVNSENANYSSENGILFNKDKTKLICYPAGKKDSSYSIPDSVTSIGLLAFAYSSLTSITIPDSVTSISGSAFGNCTSLTSVTIPNGVTSIGDNAFNNCTSLTSVTIPDSITSIGSGAFSGCTSLTSATIGNGVTSIGSWAFGNCTSLANIIIPDSITEIGMEAFYGCTSLTSITIPKSVTSLSGSAFSGCSSLTEINVSGENADYSSVNGLVFNKDKTEIICYPQGKKDLSYSIPDSVTEIGESAFYGCGLTSITMSKSVTSIGDHAFFGCTSLASITIPDSVRYLGNAAFEFCCKLESVTLGSGIAYIGNSAFCHCTSLTSVTIPDSVTNIGKAAFGHCASLANIIIPDSITEIGMEAFYGCTSLTSVIIGNGVTEIGMEAFYGCTSLTSVTTPNSITKIGDNAFGYYYDSIENKYKAVDGFTVYGYQGSAAEKYAKDNSFKFVDLREPESLTVSKAPAKMTYFVGDTLDTTGLELILIYNNGDTETVTSGFSTSGFDSSTAGTKVVTVECKGKTATFTVEVVKPRITIANNSLSFDSIGSTKSIIVTTTPSDQKIVWSSSNKNVATVSDGVVTAKGAGNATITAKFTYNNIEYTATCNVTVKSPTASITTFPDVASGDWYFNAVKFNAEKGYVTGYSNGTFGPSNNIQRQDFVLILSRIAGADLSAYEGKNGGFSDVQAGAYYASAVAWAKDKGIVTGYSADNFGVGTYISREQISLILCRYLNGSASGDVNKVLSRYSDGGNTSPWAKAGVAWAVENGIIGNSDYLNPNGNAGRAEVAQIIYNMSNKGML